MWKNGSEIVRLRHELHQFPELSMREAETRERLMRFMREHTDGTVVDCGTWFYCFFDGPSSEGAVAFRAEMDALPMQETMDLPYASRREGVSHKCGHDGHCAVLCALGMELTERPVGRPVYLIFQPGEETGEGAKVCAGSLPDRGIREIFAFHNLEGYPAGSVVVRDGLTQPASEGLILQIEGRAAHASSPEKGANPIPVLAETVLFAMRYGNRMHGGMILCTPVGLHAGTGDFGISAAKGEMRLTLRAENEMDMKDMEKAICDFAGTRAEEQGMHLTSRISDFFPETRNHAGSVAKIRKAAAAQGLPVMEMKELWRASEDFGYYLKTVKGAIFYIGTGEDHAPLHTDLYDFPDGIMENAVKLFYAVASDLPE